MKAVYGPNAPLPSRRRHDWREIKSSKPGKIFECRHCGRSRDMIGGVWFDRMGEPRTGSVPRCDA